MDRITNLRKDKVIIKRKSLSKLKIDITKPITKIVDKIIAYMAKDLDNIDLDKVKPSEYLIFENFNMDVSRVDSSVIADKVRRKCKADTKVDVYEVNVRITEDKYMRIYTIPTVKIPASSRNSIYYIPSYSENSSIVDINFIYGVFKLLDNMFEEVINKKDFYLNNEFKNISVYNNSYSEEVFDELLKLPISSKMTLKCLRGMDRKLYCEVMRFIVDAALIMQTIDSNIELTEKYNSDAKSECARAFETKKYIPQKTKSMMRNTKFLKDFKYVEIDEDTDLSKFREIEKEWQKVKLALNLDKYLVNKNPELRFKKLGKHNALGLYYPSIKCICVDTISLSSFIHEVAHFIDYTSDSGQLSLKIDFFEIINDYKKAYNKYLIENKVTESESVMIQYLTRKRNYFFTPTEIFARCMEIYLVDKGAKTSFLKEKENLEMNSGYVPLTENLIKKIRNYYDKLLVIDLEILKEETKVNNLNDASESTVNYIEPVSNTSGQFQFAI